MNRRQSFRAPSGCDGNEMRAGWKACEALTAGEPFLEENNVKIGTSLPLLARGFDDIFFPVSSAISSIEDRWRMQSGDVGVLCSTTFEIYRKVKITKERRMLTCNTARRAQFHIHGDMEKYLRTSKQILLSKKTKP